MTTQPKWRPVKRCVQLPIASPSRGDVEAEIDAGHPSGKDCVRRSSLWNMNSALKDRSNQEIA